MITLQCAQCGEPVERRLAEHKGNIKRGRVSVFCSTSCVGISQRAKLVEHICQNPRCQKPFTRKKETNDKMLFCSKQCAANNASRTRSKRSGNPSQEAKQYPCISCGKLRKSQNSPKCQECVHKEFLLTTLGDYIAGLKTSHKHSKIRAHGRLQYKGPMVCLNCGYTLHVEIAHIRAIKDFPLTTTIGEVNNPNNLMALDSRCHWEYDNGYLKFQEGVLVKTDKYPI